MSDKIYTLPKGTEPTADVIGVLIKKHESDVKRFNTLKKYYDQKPMVSRESPNSLLVIVNHAKYITKINLGYLIGNPVEYQVTKGVNIDPVLDQYKAQTIANLDAELAKNCSIFGRAYEYVYSDEESALESVKLDPRSTIVVYDDTVKRKKMFAINYEPICNDKGRKIANEYQVMIVTESAVMNRTLKGSAFLPYEEKDDEQIVFGEVPVIEYINNDDYEGDFEPVVTIIDAYNILMSDRVLDRERLIDAILAFYGMNLTPEQKKELKEGRVLTGVPMDAKIEYVIKQINEADADVLRKNLAQDLHKISMTPDLSDENFVGNSSGVAILYKLLAFEENVKTKERYFERALMERFELYNKFLSIKSNMPMVKTTEVDALFKRALPRNDFEISQMINNLVGIVDKELLVSQLSFVTDSGETVALAGKESLKDGGSNNSDNYGESGTFTGGETDETDDTED